MIIVILEFVIKLMEFILAAFFLNTILTPKHKPYITSAIFVICTYISYLAMFFLSPAQGTKTVVFLVTILILAILLYKDLLKQKLLAYMLLFIINSVAELAAAYIVIVGFGHHFADITKTGHENNLLNAYYVIVSAILYLLIITIWHKKKNSKVRYQDYIAFAIFPLSQILLLEGSFTSYDEDSKYYFLAYTVLGIILATLANLYLFKVIQQLIRKAELEKKLLQLEQHQRMSYDHLIDIEMLDRHHRMFHHDINNQITVIRILMSNNQFAEAFEMLTSLSDNIRLCDRKKYCSHPVVNAVLVQKSVYAEDRSIDLDIDVYVQESTAISSIDLCSVFSNLIDNAIEATLNLPDKNSLKCIEIKAGIKQEYLIIKVINSKNNIINKINEKYLTSKPDNNWHGLGLSIVEDIAEKYEGSFSINFTDDKFTATVLLKNKLSESFSSPSISINTTIKS